MPDTYSKHEPNPLCSIPSSNGESGYISGRRLTSAMVNFSWPSKKGLAFSNSGSISFLMASTISFVFDSLSASSCTLSVANIFGITLVMNVSTKKETRARNSGASGEEFDAGRRCDGKASAKKLETMADSVIIPLEVGPS